jgi:hypothetical protein
MMIWIGALEQRAMVIGQGMEMIKSWKAMLLAGLVAAGSACAQAGPRIWIVPDRPPPFYQVQPHSPPSQPFYPAQPYYPPSQPFYPAQPYAFPPNPVYVVPWWEQRRDWREDQRDDWRERREWDQERDYREWREHEWRREHRPDEREWQRRWRD